MIDSIPSLPHNSQVCTSLRGQSDCSSVWLPALVVFYQKVVDNNVHLFKAPVLQVGMKFVAKKSMFFSKIVWLL